MLLDVVSMDGYPFHKFCMFDSVHCFYGINTWQCALHGALHANGVLDLGSAGPFRELLRFSMSQVTFFETFVDPLRW